MTPPLGNAALAWYHQRPVREQRLLVGLALLVCAALLWAIGIAPALQTYRASGGAHAKLDAELAQMQAMALESQRLKAMPILSAAQAQTWLDTSIKKLGKATLAVQGSRVQINFTGASPEALAAWLSQARSAAQLVPLQANWRRMTAGVAGAAAPPAAQTPPAGGKSDVLWEGLIVLELPAK